MSPRKRDYATDRPKVQAERDLHAHYLRWHPVRHGRRAREQRRELLAEAALHRRVLAGGDMDAPHWIAAGEPLAARMTT